MLSPLSLHAGQLDSVVTEFMCLAVPELVTGPGLAAM